MVTVSLFILEYIKAFLHFPGHVENILMLINMEGQNVTSMPVNKLKTILGAITSQHKCVVRTIMVLNAPMAISILYRALSFFIDENTKRKINILSTNTCQMLNELTAPN